MEGIDVGAISTLVNRHELTDAQLLELLKILDSIVRNRQVVRTFAGDPAFVADVAGYETFLISLSYPEILEAFFRGGRA